MAVQQPLHCEERGTAGAAGVLGLSFVTEGAIPYAARDPLRTIPALSLVLPWPVRSRWPQASN